MDFVEFDDFPNMRAYLQRLKNLFTQYEMYDGYLTEKERCEIILAPLLDGFLTSEDAVVNNPVYREHVSALMDELLIVERAREVKEAIQARSEKRPPIGKVYERKNKKLKMDGGSAAEDDNNSSSSSQSSTDSSSDSNAST